MHQIVVVVLFLHTHVYKEKGSPPIATAMWVTMGTNNMISGSNKGGAGYTL